MNINIDQIKIGKRIRKHLGDITSLANSINEIGLLHPVVLDKEYRLITGRRRIEAFKQLGHDKIDCRIVGNLAEALDLLKAERDENVCRMDFVPTEALALAERLEPMERAAAAERQAATQAKLGEGKVGGADSAPPDNKEVTGKARDKISEAVGCSHDTLKKIKDVVEAAKEDPEFKLIVEQMDDTGNVSKAFKELKKKKREKDIERQKEDIENNIDPPNGLYDIIVIDPPWPYGTKYDPDGRRAANPYPEMSLEQIAAIELPVSDNAILWLWTTHKFMRHSFELIDKWGFRDVAILTWIKDRIGLGSWLRSQSEFCIMAVKGKPVINLTNESTIINGSLREHSRKPDEFYKMVDSLCIGRKIDYFSREKRTGWAQAGNDVDKFKR